MKKAFTLIELMIASSVLVVALLGLLGVFTGSFGLIESGRNLTVALNHARCVMEEIRDCNIPSFITVQDWADWAKADAPGGGGCNSLNNEQVLVSYTDRDGDGDAKNDDPLCITVTVNWTQKGRPMNVRLITLLAER